MMSDYTFFVTETKKMLGEATSTERVRAFREREKLKQIGTLHETVSKPTEQATIINVVETTETEKKRFDETELEIDIELDIEKKKVKRKNKSFSPPNPKRSH